MKVFLFVSVFLSLKIYGLDEPCSQGAKVFHLKDFQKKAPEGPELKKAGEETRNERIAREFREHRLKENDLLLKAWMHLSHGRSEQYTSHINEIYGILKRTELKELTNEDIVELEGGHTGATYHSLYGRIGERKLITHKLDTLLSLNVTFPIVKVQNDKFDYYIEYETRAYLRQNKVFLNLEEDSFEISAQKVLANILVYLVDAPLGLDAYTMFGRKMVLPAVGREAFSNHYNVWSRPDFNIPFSLLQHPKVKEALRKIHYYNKNHKEFRDLFQDDLDERKMRSLLIRIETLYERYPMING